MQTFLQHAHRLGELRLFDLQFANHMLRINGADTAELLLAAALVSNRLAQGDTCLALDTVADSSLYKSSELLSVRQKLPAVNKWRQILLEQKVVAEVIDEDETEATEQQLSPLLLDKNNRLYLARYWALERSLIQSIHAMLERPRPEIDKARLRLLLDTLFKHSDTPDWQKVSVATACISNFCVITGGPGTGKTYTVAALLSALVNLGVNANRIALAAPTGKAAARLTQSIQNTLAADPEKFSLANTQFEAVTLHSLLGVRFDRVNPYHHKNIPLPHDVIIIDEASMIDLPLMTRTFDAIAPSAKIVLLGDKDQLHSVESGMVLGDLCGGRTRAELSSSLCDLLGELGINDLPVCAEPGGSISDHIVYLHKSHRVKDGGGIGNLSAAVNAGDADQVLELLQSSSSESLILLPHSAESMTKVLRDYVIPPYAAIAASSSPAEALSKMAETGVLCALRHGSTGAIAINRKVEKLLAEQRIIEPHNVFYDGRPIMITANSRYQGLLNGDHGLLLEDENGKLVHFDFEDNNGDRKTVSPSRLPQHETFYAMTIHKSQGSEYSTVVVFLPDVDSPILSRELLYTAITRARERVIIVANEEQLSVCVARRSVRQSGMRDVFWHKPVAPLKVDKPKPEPPQVPVQTTLDF